jgi:hypothetical protein
MSESLTGKEFWKSIAWLGFFAGALVVGAEVLLDA